MHLEILIEEPSAQPVLENLLPKIAPGTTFRLITFQGKKDLLTKLPHRLAAYANWLPTDHKIVVLIDEDRQDCRRLKQELETAAQQANLATKSHPDAEGRFIVLNRIAVEELEAWFFGDLAALRTAYPRIPASLNKKQNYRYPDQIMGGTWEALERVLQQAGYFAGGLPKTKVAKDVAPHMQPEINLSPSFQTFRHGLLALLATGD